MHLCIVGTDTLCTVNLVKLAKGRGELVATKWENPLIEVTCNNSPEFCLLQVLLN